MTDNAAPTSTPERPSWAGGSGTSSFTPPNASPARPSQSEHRPPKGPRKNNAAQKKPGRLGTVFLSMIVVVLVVAAGLMLWKALTPENVEAPLPASEFEKPVGGAAVGATGTEPVALDNGQTMTTTDMAPDTLFIPALAVYMPVEADSRVVPTHYAGFSGLKIPSDPTHGVRFAGGAPMYGSATGTTLIAGHVSTKTAWGALRYLYKLTGGEMIYTKDATGQLQTWQMTKMSVKDQTAFPQEYWSPEGERRLVVTTCGGKVGPNHLFTQNIFAVAVPVGPVAASPEQQHAANVAASTSAPVAQP